MSRSDDMAHGGTVGPYAMNQRLHDFAGLDIDPLAALRHSRGLQHLTDEELAPLARELQPVRYDSGTTFFKQFEANHDAPLRVLLQGQLFWTPIANVETAGAPTLDAGALFGLSSINAWARKHPSWSVLAVDEHPGFLAEANDELWALELPLNSYHRAFARPESKRLITRLIGLYGARPDAPKVVRALRRTPEFSRACPMHVSRVVEGGVLERWLPDKPILADGSSEHMALRYVVSGKVRVIDEHDGQSTVVGANELIPHRAIFSDRGPARTFIAIDGPAEVIRIRRQTLDFTIRTTPGFARTLGPATLGSWLRDSAGYERSYPIIASGEMTLVLADPTVDPLPLSALCALLAEAANEHLDDRTTVVKLVPAGPEVAPRSSPFGVPEILPVAKEGDFAAAVRETIIDLAHQWGLLFDHIILDPSPLALTPKERLAVQHAGRLVGPWRTAMKIDFAIAVTEDPLVGGVGLRNLSRPTLVVDESFVDVAEPERRYRLAFAAAALATGLGVIYDSGNLTLPDLLDALMALAKPRHEPATDTARALVDTLAARG
ncbi:MAG: hypothetical protein KC457_18215, partial [Myxococcales bacterium]|nr:hypothetical protein [Myxococcales bacterium]